MLRKSYFALAIAALSTASAFAAISAEQAINTAEQQGKGQAIGFKLEKKDNKEIYAVKLIGEKGFERLLINAADGAIVVEKHPEFTAPAFSLKQALATGEKLGKVVGIHYMDGKMPPRPEQGKAGENRAPHGDKAANGERPAHDGKAPNDMPPPPAHDGKAPNDMPPPPAHDDKAAKEGADKADKRDKKRQPIYMIMIEKEGKIEHHAISAADGSAVELPKFERGENGGKGRPEQGKAEQKGEHKAQ